MPDPTEQAAAQAAPAAATAELSEFDALLNKEFKPKTDEAKSAVARQCNAGPTGHR